MRGDVGSAYPQHRGVRHHAADGDYLATTGMRQDNVIGHSGSSRGATAARWKCQPGGSVVRIVGEENEPREFSTFSPAAIAMIGNLPGTLADRSIPITLKRKRP